MSPQFPYINCPQIQFSCIVVGALSQPDVAHPCLHTHRQVPQPSPVMHSPQPQLLHMPVGGWWCYLAKPRSPMWSCAFAWTRSWTRFHSSLNHSISAPSLICDCSGLVHAWSQKSFLRCQACSQLFYSCLSPESLLLAVCRYPLPGLQIWGLGWYVPAWHSLPSPHLD